MTFLRELGGIRVSSGATRVLQRIGIAPECIADQHQRGEWGGVMGLRGSLWAHNARMDTHGVGGWISLHEVGRDVYLWIVTTVTVTARERRTYVYLDSEQPPRMGGKGE